MNLFMRPLIFFPVAIFGALLIIAFGVEPQRWPRAAEPVDGTMEGQTLVLAGDALGAPSPSPDQHLTVHRTFWGKPESLSIAVLPNQPAPTPAERGVRILLSPEAAMGLQDLPIIVEVTYAPLGVNPAFGLAVSLQGIAPADWMIAPLPPEPGTARFELPPQIAVDAIGLRAMSDSTESAHGLRITGIRITPAGA